MVDKRKLSNKFTGIMLPNQTINAEMAKRQALRSIGAGLVKFSGNTSSFADESKTQEVFQIKLVNSDTDDHVIALHPGLLASVAEIAAVAGVTVEAIATDGTVIATKVTGSTKANTTIKFFQAFVNKNATRIIRMQVQASAEDQLSESIVITKINPTTRLGNQVITPADYKRSTDTNAKLVTIDLSQHQLDDQSVMHTNLLAGSTLTINLYLGAARNDAAMLESIAASAKA